MSDDDLGPACRAPEKPGKPPVYYGKYRGRVESNLDEELMGRIQVSCPAVPGLRLGWAMPCVPYAGPGVGWFAIPPIGADVWVEFEAGDPNYPIWSGCFWQAGQIPVTTGDPGTKAFVTTSCRMVMNDLVEEGGGWTVAVDLAASTVATAEETQSATAAGADAGIAAADAVADAAGGLAGAGAGVAADAAGDAEAAASESEWAALKAESAEDEVVEEGGEMVGVYSIAITSTGITVSVPVAQIRMTPETIMATVPEAVLTMSSGEVSVNVPESTLSLVPALITASCPPGRLEVSGEAVMMSIGSTSVTLSEPIIEVESDTTSVTAVLEVEGDSNFTGAVEVEGNTALTGALEVDGANVEIAAGAIELTAGDINETGAVTVEGGILEDGLPVMVVP